MSDLSGRSAYARFSPEVRGWAALRLLALMPRPLRMETENLARRNASNFPDSPTCTAATASTVGAADPNAGWVYAGGPGHSFASAALAVVSTPAAIAWSRAMAEQVPVLGPAAGPACIARLWVARLLRPDGGLEAYWPGVVDDVWRVLRPTLMRLGVEVGGGYRDERRHEVAAPLALVLLKSLAAGRKDLRLLDIGDADRADGPPLGWAPGIDSLSAVIRYLAAGQVPGRFRSHALLSSPLAKLLSGAGLAAAVTSVRGWCPDCRTSEEGAADRCPHCGAALALRRGQRLVACGVMARLGAAAYRAPRSLRTQPQAQPEAEHLAVDDRVDAAAARRRCIGRARVLWCTIIMGRRADVAARVVLGALAGVQPLALVAERPAPRHEWLQRLVEALVEDRLDRVPLACQASTAAPEVAERLDRPTPVILSSHVGVLATRFRHVVFAAPPVTPRT